VSRGREYDILVDKKYGEIVADDFSIRNYPCRTPKFYGGYADQAEEKQQGKEQIVLKDKLAKLSAD
jgi:hypothetical protein